MPRANGPTPHWRKRKWAHAGARGVTDCPRNRQLGFWQFRSFARNPRPNSVPRPFARLAGRPKGWLVLSFTGHSTTGYSFQGWLVQPVPITFFNVKQSGFCYFHRIKYREKSCTRSSVPTRATEWHNGLPTRHSKGGERPEPDDVDDVNIWSDCARLLPSLAASPTRRASWTRR